MNEGWHEDFGDCPAVEEAYPDEQCMCLGCNCVEDAEALDDNGIPVCNECNTYFTTEEGFIVCAKMTENFTKCHHCEQKIEWGGIMTRQFHNNWREGTCRCGQWRDDERGSWGHYSYQRNSNDE